jgi:heat shock protein HslJ
MAYVLGPGNGLGFRHFESTLVGCDGPDSLETRYFRALANTRRLEMDADTLSLLAADGSRLTFVAALDSASQR